VKTGAFVKADCSGPQVFLPPNHPSVSRQVDSHSSRYSAYSTPACSAPSMESGQSKKKVRTNYRPAFSMTRREATLTAIVLANTRRTPYSLKPFWISAREPSVA
jgi:hypothetical protein